MGTPLPILFKVVRHMLGQKNVSGVPAIHHSLGQLIPAPATLERSFTSVVPLTGPLWIPMRTRSSGCS